ncbi:hypothetical protein [Abyssalbus ytuae]|uniref:Uncharacterized protein n=1 Tax=Abyssalbus ytuae TaxID=2926907 RepID=A0A9E7A1M7_9FLAO|nr:hypothetical protein [Abyssalbus ytuae]UOB19357.1 hypothetical protein MQE35_08670 [Abyssalbus ytuae]
MNKNFDGQIYFDEKDLPKAEKMFADDVITESDETHPIEIELSEIQLTDTVIYERKLASWKDLTTLPKIRTKCVKICRIGPIKTCCGWKTQIKWYYRTATLIVSTKKPSDIKNAVENCIKTAAIAAAIAAIVSGGSAAVGAAEKVLYSCLLSKLGDNLLSVRIDLSGRWGDWS